MQKDVEKALQSYIEDIFKDMHIKKDLKLSNS